jgi:hypothetical protein
MTKLTNTQVIENWISDIKGLINSNRQRPHKGYGNKDDNLRAQGGIAYSYQTIIAIYEHGIETIAVTNEKYSQTTSKHCRLIEKLATKHGIKIKRFEHGSFRLLTD